MKKNYPMWHIRFTDARNHLSQAVADMEQAWFEDAHNPVFKDLHDRLDRIFDEVVTQSMKNLARIK